MAYELLIWRKRIRVILKSCPYNYPTINSQNYFSNFKQETGRMPERPVDSKCHWQPTMTTNRTEISILFCNILVCSLYIIVLYHRHFITKIVIKHNGAQKFTAAVLLGGICNLTNSSLPGWNEGKILEQFSNHIKFAIPVNYFRD
jgi:hypothetical protein